MKGGEEGGGGEGGGEGEEGEGEGSGAPTPQAPQQPTPEMIALAAKLPELVGGGGGGWGYKSRLPFDFGGCLILVINAAEEISRPIALDAILFNFAVPNSVTLMFDVE